MNTTHASAALKWKVGIFSLLGLALIGGITVYVNDKPFWWRSCQMVHINVEDASGLKSKSMVRSLGIEIGYIDSVELEETHVTLNLCITAPVEVLPTTRAYLKGEGFLGDKFVELRPVRYIRGPEAKAEEKKPDEPVPAASASPSSGLWKRPLNWIEASAFADDQPGVSASTVPAPAKPAAKVAAKPVAREAADADSNREIPVGEQSQDIQEMMGKVNDLVNQVSDLANNLKESFNPSDMRKTMKELNQTLENASRTLAPEGGLTQTAQRALAKLEDAIDQLRDQITRVNQGQGSVGMLLNDPSYAEEIREAIRNVNRLLSRVGGTRFVVDVGGYEMFGYDSGRGYAELNIWPRSDRYYRLGLSIDPLGRLTTVDTTSTAGGTTNKSSTTYNETTGILLTGMLGKVFWRRVDFSLGALYSQATGSIQLNLGPRDKEEMFQLRDDIYSRSGVGIDNRAYVTIRPIMSLYARAGLDSINKVNNSLAFFVGGGVSFDDEDIKILFALR